MSNWYTCPHCGERSNGDYKRDNHEEVNHPEQHRQRKMLELRQAIENHEHLVKAWRDNLAFLEAGHTVAEMRKHSEERSDAEQEARYRAQAEAEVKQLA